MKRKLALIILSVIFIVSLVIVAGCNSTPVSFSKEEYELYNGDSVSVNAKNAMYELLTVVDGVSIDEKSGVVSVESSVSDCTQVIIAAKIKNRIVATTIARLHTSTETPVISFSNLSQYIVDGDTVTAVSTPMYSVSYSLKQDIAGISINSVTGRVSFSSKVNDGTEFTIVAKAKEVTAEKTFFVTKGNYVTVSNSSQIAEYKVGSDVTFNLNYGDNPQAEQAGVLAVMRGHNRLSNDDWTYNAANNTLTVKSSLVSQLSMGENNLKIVTAKNAVSVTVQVATYVATAQDLAAINDSREALSGNYIMVCDIDLSHYLSIDGEGYNNGRGWTPLGTYFDVTDGTATDWAFNGTFDGNGHTISGFFIDRADDYAYNSGFFGYITAQGIVKNLGIVNAEGRVNNVRSYSGGFAGVNVGKIYDCWADVSVITGEAFKVVGGFVGRNEGEIVNCYSLGKVSGGLDVGSFAGVSKTPISLGTATNCYAVQTDNYPFSDDYDASCKVFKNKEQLIADADFASYTNAWNVVSGQLPVLKSTYLPYNLRELTVTSNKSFVTRGDTLQLNVRTNPVNIAVEAGCTYKVLEGKGVRVSEKGVVSTDQVQRPSDHGPIHCAIQVTCQSMSTVFEFDIYDKVSEVKFSDTMEDTLYAGNFYRIEAQVLPLTANQQLTYSIIKSLNGVTLSENIIAVSNYVLDGEIVVKATAVDGSSQTLSIRVVGNVKFDDNYKLIYREDSGNIEFTLPQGATANLTKVTRYDKQIPFKTNGDNVLLDRSYFTEFLNREIPVKFITDSSIFAGTVVAYNKTDVYEIGSVEAFMQYKADFMLDVSLRSKTVVLTADLDFEGATITSIGSHHVGADFFGVFNGNGHAIRNLNIDRNDFSGEYIGEEDGKKKGDYDVYPYHASRFNVGLFSYVTGSVCNVSFENVTVASYFTGSYDTGNSVLNYEKEPIGNFVGIVAGTVNGTVSNCTFTNCNVKASGDLKGIICGKDTATTVINCFINSELYEK